MKAQDSTCPCGHPLDDHAITTTHQIRCGVITAGQRCPCARLPVRMTKIRNNPVDPDTLYAHRATLNAARATLPPDVWFVLDTLLREIEANAATLVAFLCDAGDAAPALRGEAIAARGRLSEVIATWPGAARRAGDGYWNATSFCLAHGQRIHDFLTDDGRRPSSPASGPTRETLDMLARTYERPAVKMTDDVVWLEERAMLFLAWWCDVRYQLWVLEVFDLGRALLGRALEEIARRLSGDIEA